jgi:hypothetical protein
MNLRGSRLSERPGENQSFPRARVSYHGRITELRGGGQTTPTRQTRKADAVEHLQLRVQSCVPLLARPTNA